MALKDEQMMGTRQPQKPIIQKSGKDQGRSRVLNDNQSEDYDFWTMPSN